MLKVAGEVGDGVIVNWNSPEDVPKSVEVVREAARKAGRDPAAIEVTARLFVNLDPPGPESDQIIKRHIAAYLNVPVYRAYQEWLGRTPILQPMWDRWAAGDRKGAVAAIPATLVEELVVRGPLPAIRARVQRYLDHGIDTAFLQFQTNDPDPSRRRALVLDAMRGLAPSTRAQETPMSDEVLCAIDGGVATVTLNRPGQRNAMNTALLAALRARFDELDGNRDVRVVVVRGAGPAFCSGMDLKGDGGAGRRAGSRSRERRHRGARARGALAPSDHRRGARRRHRGRLRARASL